MAEISVNSQTCTNELYNSDCFGNGVTTAERSLHFGIKYLIFGLVINRDLWFQNTNSWGCCSYLLLTHDKNKLSIFFFRAMISFEVIFCLESYLPGQKSCSKAFGCICSSKPGCPNYGPGAKWGPHLLDKLVPSLPDMNFYYKFTNSSQTYLLKLTFYLKQSFINVWGTVRMSNLMFHYIDHQSVPPFMLYIFQYMTFHVKSLDTSGSNVSTLIITSIVTCCLKSDFTVPA